MMRSLRFQALGLMLLLPLPAQNVGTAGSRGGEPILVFKSGDMMPTMRLGRALGLRQRPPQLEAGQHYVLILGADGEVEFAVGDGEIGFVELHADPVALAGVYDAELARAKQTASAMANLMIGGRSGGANLAPMLDAVFDFPTQVASLDLVIPRHPKQAAEEGFDLTLSLRPAPGSSFEKLMAKAAPSPRGAPAAPAGDALVRARWSLAPAAMESLLGSVVELQKRVLGTDPETSAKAAKVVDVFRRMTELYDGAGAVSIAPEGAVEALMGCRDGDAFASLVGSDDYAEMARGQKSMVRRVEVEFERDALKHRGVSLHETTIYNDGPPNPMFPDDGMHQFSGVAGNYFVMGASEASAKRLVDLALDGRIERSPLPDGAILRVDLSLTALGAVTGRKELPPDAPRKVAIQLRPSGKALVLSVKAK